MRHSVDRETLVFTWKRARGLGFFWLSNITAGAANHKAFTTGTKYNIQLMPPMDCSAGIWMDATVVGGQPVTHVVVSQLKSMRFGIRRIMLELAKWAERLSKRMQLDNYINERNR